MRIWELRVRKKKLSKAWVKGLKSSTWRLDKEKEIEIKREKGVWGGKNGRKHEKVQENGKRGWVLQG